MEIDFGEKKKLTEFKSKMQVTIFLNDFVIWTIIKVFFLNLLKHCHCVMFWFGGHKACAI